MNPNSPNNSSRRKFILNTSLAATGFFIVPDNVLGFAPSSRAFADNPIHLENAKAGTTTWQLTNPALNREVEGYASLTSVNRGGAIKFFISVAQAQQVNLQIYRMGWYGGNGARLLGQASIAGINQPTPTHPLSNALVECNWVSHYTLNIPNNTSDPTDWASGIYLAKLTAATSGKQSYIIFVVRDDLRTSDFLYQASFATYQAYNNWPYQRTGPGCGSIACYGSRSLYPHNSDQYGSAWKVSFNRPFAVGIAPGSEIGVGAGEFITTLQQGTSLDAAGWEYNMVRWLEMKGYDVTYATNIDTHEKTDLLLNGTTRKHKGFLSVGHDEYWSWQMRDQVEQARDNGVSLGFFSSNVCYWQMRLEPSSIIPTQLNRTMVCYKNVSGTKDPYAIDKNSSNDRLTTTLWRNSPVNRPEAAMVGVMYWTGIWHVDMVITNPSHWICAGTNLALNEVLPGLIGYEVDEVVASSPTNIGIIAHSPVGNGRFADTTTYTTPGGAVVFGAGSNQLSWGLDDYNASGPSPLRPSRLNPKFQQMVINLLTRMIGNQPPPPPPTSINAPSGLNAVLASGNSGQVQLSWVDNSNNEQLFHIERSLSPSGGFTEIAQVNANVTSYTDKGDKNTTYYYRVRASSGSTFSAYSSTDSSANRIADAKGESYEAARGEKDSDINIRATELNIKAVPNLSSGGFNVQIEAGSSGKITMRVIDIRGRLLEQHQNVKPNHVLRIGQNYVAGIYFIEAIQGVKRDLVKLVKFNN
ncbi:MAG: N,N-dimethylformamidase beta subunit family domain-containing protein [Chitinophagaceae bacterium]